MRRPDDEQSVRKVFRDTIKEHRGRYYVTYKPADVGLPFASLQLVFPELGIGSAEVRHLMEHELKNWLHRYPVPLKVTAFDAKDSVIQVGADSMESHLMGYAEPQTGRITAIWGVLKDDELPVDQMSAAYLEGVYKDVPYRFQEDVRRKARHEARLRGRLLRTFVLLTVAVPVLIEIVALGVAWLGHLLAAVSIAAGFYKLGRAMGWFKPTKRDEEKAEKERKKEHYFYHCERNPDAFNRLKCENFEREAVEQTYKESEDIRRQQQ